MSTKQQVLVSYSGPKFFLGTQRWSIFYQSMVAQLPLRNIHWRASSQNTVRTIQELDVKLAPLESIRDELVSQIPVTVLEKPILHIYVAHCEDTDLETYKALKKEIKDWNIVVTSKKNPEWLILQIVTADPSKQSRNVFFKGSVLDKLKTDFNVDKRDRCAQIMYSPGNNNPLVWAEFFNRMKEGLLCAFDTAIALRQEEVRRSESQQQMPGWNFCTFFILKESLAISYEGMNIFEEALSQYEELETLFLQISKEKNMSWFGSLVSAAPGDDSAPLLSVTKKPYRNLILANTISVFDFRIYMLSRQCELIAKMQHPHEVPMKVISFLGTFSKRLSEVEADLPKFFIESWIYSSAIDAVEQCTAWGKKYASEGTNDSAVSGGIGELLDLARSQLDIIGIEVGYLPNEPPFSISLPDRKGRSRVCGNGSISNKDILTVIEDRDAFYDLYIQHTNTAIATYAKAGKRKFALKLHGILAALDFHRGHLEKALGTYSSLPAHYAPHFWISLESHMLSRALDTHRKLGKDQDVEWIHILLAFLKAYVEHRGTDMLFPEEDGVGYVSKFIQSLKEAATGLETDLRHPDHPALSIRPAKKAKLAGNRDGSYLDVVVHNYLPCPFPADELNIVLSGREAENFRFNSSVEGLPPGKTQLTLFCPTAISGTLLLESSEVRAAKLLLQYPQKKLLGKPAHHHHIVQIPPDPLTLHVRVFQSRKVELGRPFSVSLRLWTGRSAVSTLVLRLSASSTTFRYREATLDDDGAEVAFDASDALYLHNLAQDTTVRFSIPYSDASAMQTMQIDVAVNYTTVEEPDLERSLHFSSSLSPSLPVSVNVQDWFRETRLLSTFSVSSTTHQYVRIAEANLEVPETVDDLQVTPCNIRKGIITVTPNEPAKFLFALDSPSGPVKDSLTFHIKYRLLRDEVGAIIEDQVRRTLEESSISQSLRPNIVDKVIEMLERDSSWVAMYKMTGEVKVPELAEKEQGDLGEMLLKSIDGLRAHRHPKVPEGVWRELRLPVDVPVKSIVATASINIISTPFSAGENPNAKLPLYAGQPISAELTIRTTFRWGLENDSSRRYVLNYQVEDMTREWLIGGFKQGDFIAEHDGTHTIPITLMALHHGEFGLPKIHVQPLSAMRDVTVGSLAPPSVETYQEHSAMKILVLPRGGRSTFVVSMGPTPMPES